MRAYKQRERGREEAFNLSLFSWNNRLQLWYALLFLLRPQNFSLSVQSDHLRNLSGGWIFPSQFRGPFCLSVCPSLPPSPPPSPPPRPQTIFYSCPQFVITNLLPLSFLCLHSFFCPSLKSIACSPIFSPFLPRRLKSLPISRVSCPKYHFPPLPSSIMRQNLVQCRPLHCRSSKPQLRLTVFLLRDVFKQLLKFHFATTTTTKSG